jgi:DNA primase
MGGVFSSDSLERIRAANDIVEVIGSYVPLKRAGGNFVALCPFHREKTPSFNVNPNRQTFHCFGCNKGGDVFEFVKEYESVDFPEAVRRLAERARIPLDYEKGGTEQKSRHLKERLLQIHEQITQRWQAALANEAGGQPARDYLAKRGVSAEAIQLFRLGCAPEAWDDTVNWAKNRGHELELVEQAGLILRKAGTEHYYDRFRGRLIFPICDEQGRVVGFSGRVLSADEKTAKYVNSPETPIFSKSKVIFGLDKSKRSLLEQEFAVVCEGQLDLIACYMAGVRNVVAPQGTAFTGDHARVLKRYVEEIVLCFDSDEAGQKATVRSLDHLLGCGLAVRVAVVPAPHDPDSFIRTLGAEAFRKLIGNAEGFFDYYLKRLCATNEMTSDRGRLAVLLAMGEAVQKTGNGVLIDTYAQKTALRLGVAPDAVRAEFRKSARMKPSAVERPAPSGSAEGAAKPQPLPPLEEWLLRLVLTHDELVEWTADRLDPDWLTHPVAKEILGERIACLRTGSWCGVAAFLGGFPAEATRQLISAVVAEPRAVPEPEKTLKGDPMHTDKRGVLERLRNEFIDREMAAANRRISQPDTTEVERLDLLRKRQELRVAKAQPLSVRHHG